MGTMQLNWQGWAYGLVSGFIGGGAGAISTGFAQVLIDPAHADVHHLFLLMGTSFLVAGALTSAAYLARSPLPPAEPTITVATAVTTQPGEATKKTVTVATTSTIPPEPKP